ncbi:MAG: adenylate/guanylate cyclase domain-containing protein [Pseudomonadota bacterium]
MANVLWRGSWATRIRIASGLVLMLYVTLHLLNIAAVLISPGFFDAVQTVRVAVVRSTPGTLVTFLALSAHMVLALSRLALARTLRMPASEAVQIALGLIIPLLLVSHVVYTRAASELLGVNTMFGYVTSLIWNGTDGWLQALLMVVTWVHGCIGLHMWLRLTDTWQRVLPWMIAVAVLVPTLALMGYVSFARVIDGLISDTRARELAHDVWNWPDADGFAQLATIDQNGERAMWALLALVALIFGLRRALAAIRKPVRITYVDGPTVRAPRWQTLLETSITSGVSHTALCGGRGRCTTCRVIVEEGLDDLPPPSEAEKRSLKAVGAPPNTRLACQVTPSGPVTVFRVFASDGKRSRAHASQGKEAQLAVLFLDMRGFTARTDGQLPYDVVFLLNRFFDEIVPPIVAAGGTVDKYMGDGLMAVFETSSAASSAQAALQAVQGIGAALAHFNTTLTNEGSAPVAIGMGVHLGNVVLGEIGAAGQAPRTLIGDTVNIASRLEGETKALGVQALISADALTAAGGTPETGNMVPLTLRGHDGALPALPVADATALGTALSGIGLRLRPA